MLTLRPLVLLTIALLLSFSSLGLLTSFADSGDTSRSVIKGAREHIYLTEATESGFTNKEDYRKWLVEVGGYTLEQVQLESDSMWAISELYQAGAPQEERDAAMQRFLTEFDALSNAPTP